MEKCVKKRGRKPKGGKIIEQLCDDDETSSRESVEAPVQNIILHLKCYRRDLLEEIKTASHVALQVEPFSSETTFESVASAESNSELTFQQKLNQLSVQLRNNDVSKKSDCFWCTYPFETPTVYIPKSKINGQYHVYGSFCCPQCAAAFIFADTVTDNTTKFERYHLLNFMYGGLYGYSKNILPAPAPHYLLDKYYGTLTIDDFRCMVQTDKLVTVVDKPIYVTCPDILQGHRSLTEEKSGEETGYRLCRKKKQDKV